MTHCPAADIAWHDNVDVAWKEAREQERPLLVFITTAGCRYCTMMHNVTFADPDVAALIDQGFVPAAVDAAAVDWLVQDQKISSFPTTLVISREAKVVDRIKGYLKPAEIKPRLTRSAAAQRTASREPARQR
jgi:thioredoxin-related protein